MRTSLLTTVSAILEAQKMAYDKSSTPVIRDAKELCAFTLKKTQNLNNFPKKYRFTLVDKIVRTSFEIYDHIEEANSCRGAERIGHQTKALTACRRMKFYLQLVYEILRPECDVPHWSGKVDKIEVQVRKWRASTK